MAQQHRLVLAGVVALLGVLGLLTAATTHQVALYWAGLLIFGLAIVFIFIAIKRYFDVREAQEAAEEGEAE